MKNDQQDQHQEKLFILTNDGVKRAEIINKILATNRKDRWSFFAISIFILWNNFVLIMNAIRVCHTFQQPVSNIFYGCLTVLFVLGAIVILKVYKSLRYRSESTEDAYVIYLNYQFEKMVRQHNLTLVYIFSHFAMLSGSFLFFFVSMKNWDAILHMLQMTMPGALITYSLGYYLVRNFNKRKQEIAALIKKTDCMVPSKRPISITFSNN